MNIIEWLKKFFHKEEVKYQDDWRNSALPSPVDERDIKLGAIQEFYPTPETYNIPYVLRVHDQHQKPICAGETGSLIKEFLERREGNFVDFDSEFLYREAKKIDGFPNFQGTHARAILSVLKNKGCKPLDGTVEDAEKFKIGTYASVKPTFQELKTAIYQNGVVWARMVGSNQGWTMSRVIPPKSGELLFGHHIGLIGYDKDFIYFENSWGNDWGLKGIGCFSQNYLPTEAWAILSDYPTSNYIPATKPVHQFDVDLKQGDQGIEVEWLQKCLAFDGEFLEIPIGTFGPKTFQSVKDFQTKYGLPSTGYAGKLTRAKLSELFK